MDELQQAINEAVWLLEEGRQAEALAVLLRHYDEDRKAGRTPALGSDAARQDAGDWSH